MPTYTKVLSGNSEYYIAMTVTQASQSVSNNTSTLSWNLTVTKKSGSGYWVNSPYYASFNASINGSSVVNSTAQYDFRNSTPKTITFASGSVTVPHNADGTKSVAVSAYWTDNGNSGLGSGTASGTMTLTTIPRATQPSVSASSVAIGSAVTISMPRASGSFTHTLWYQINGGSWIGIGSGYGTSTSWTLPNSIMSSIPNATKATLTIICRTMNGSTTIGDKTVSITGTVPSSIVPSFSSLNLSEANSTIASKVGIYVAGHSRVTASISGAAGTYGSTITSYRITGGGSTINASSGTTDTITSSGTVTFTGTITDSRGRSASRSASISVLPYTQPQASISAIRTDSSGTSLWNGTYIKASVTGSVVSLLNGSTQKNTLTIYLDHLSSSATSWTNYRTINNGSTITLSNSYTNGTFDAISSYMIRIRVVDNLGSTAIAYVTVPTATIALDIGIDNVGVGKMHERGTIDALGQIFQHNGIQVPNGFVDSLPAGDCDSAGYWRNMIGGQYRSGSGTQLTNGKGAWAQVIVKRDLGDEAAVRHTRVFWLTQNGNVYYGFCTESDTSMKWSRLFGDYTDSVIRSVTENGYPGLASAGGDATTWIRTTVNGIIPHASGYASALGTATWRFASACIRDIYPLDSSSRISDFPIDGGVNFIKWYSGALWQWGRVSGNTVYNSAQFNMHYYTVPLGNFPIAFTSIQSCVRTYATSTHLYLIAGFSDYSTTNLGTGRLIHTSSGMAGNAIVYTYFAIGRWK